jgi:hypothetical protein
VLDLLRARRRQFLSGGSVSLAAATVAGFALVNPGYPTADVQLNDGGVWVTNGSDLMVGRLNRQIDELDSALTATGDDVDVLQEAGTVFAVQPGSGSLSRIDVSYVRLQDDDVAVPTGAQVGLGGGRLTVHDPVTGGVWVRPADQVDALDVAAQQPDLALGPGGEVAVGPGGVVAGVSVEDDQLTVLDPAGARRSIELGRDVETARVTVVGDQPVVLDVERNQLITADGAAHDLGDAANAALQQPGPAADGVLVATDSALLDVPLAGGDPRPLAEGTGGPIAPVRVAGCAHAAWTSTPTYVRDCPGQEQLAVPINQAEPGAALTFRVNRSVVVLNDTESGLVWLLDEDMTPVDNWDDVRPPDPKDRTDEESDDFDQTETLQRDEENQPPVANDDQYGARLKLPTLLPVLDNDTDPDGDVLIITGVDVPDDGTGVAIVGDGSRLQFTAAAGASGTVRFGYTIGDGRGGTDSAEVRVEIHPDSVNGAPRQIRDTKTVVEQGRTVVHDVLTDWLDPDGDELTLASARVTADGEVRSESDGTVTYTASGAPGLKDVDLEVSDGRETGTGKLSIEVRPPGQLPPTARADHVTAFVGETATVSPLLNDTDPNQDPLRLSSVEADKALTVVPDYVAGTFTVTAEEADTYYAVYTVVAGPSSAQALVRVDVLAGETNTPPVAVRDLAFVPAAGSTTVDVLANDIDVDGDVLVVTSVGSAPGLAVSVRDHRFLTIAAESLLTEPVTVTYVVSDGAQEANGAVIVRGRPPNAVNLPPVPTPDTATVRAGDVLTLDVLANDTDPDGDVLTLLPELAEPASAGTISVVGNRLRVQAPDQPGTVRAVYQVADTAGQSSGGQVTVYVRPNDDKNAPPTPRALTARALTGTQVRIDIPLQGIDADGDSVHLVGIDQAPTKGRIVQVGTDYLVYEAYQATGTDRFTYVVEDRRGARGTAALEVGIAPRTDGNQPPSAQDDTATTRPGRTVTVDVLANDSDPDGDALAFDDDPLTVPDGVEARLSGGRVTVVAPAEGAASVQYRVSDRHGGTDEGVLTVTADAAAPLKPPIAVDDVISVDELEPGAFLPVDVLANDSDPDGSTQDLSVRVDVSGSVARVDDQGRVLVRGADEAQVIPYTITDIDDQSATAAVLVPAAANLPPRFRPGVNPVTVGSDGESWDLADLVVDPEGNDVRLTRVPTATNSNGSLTDGETNLRFTPAENYGGPASLTFEVTDGAGPGDPNGRTAVLTLQITVDSDVNQPPHFAGASLTPAVGEDPVTLDLGPLAKDPDGDDLSFALPGATPAGFEVELDGSVLRVAAKDDAVAGTVGRLELTVDDGSNPPQPAVVNLEVRSSSRPLARAVADTAQADQGDPVTVPVLANDVNPFPDTPLTITRASVAAGRGDVSVSDDSVTVTPGGDFVGTVTVQYTVRDKTGDAAREVTGLLTVTVRGRPAQPAAPTVLEVRDSTVVLTWASPAANGAPIDGYRVQAEGVAQDCPTTTCTIGGLRNGTTYYFTVTAHNEVGDSPASPRSGPARPDNQPDMPNAPTLEFGDGELTATWTPPNNTGTPITHYEAEISPGGAAVRVSGTSYTFRGLANGTSYQVRVRAFNDAPDPSEWSPYSAPEIPAGVPGQPVAPTATRIDTELGGQVKVDWAEPSTNGDPVASYSLVMYVNGSAAQTMQYPGGTTTTTLTVDNAKDYSFTVSATNKAGESPASPQSSAVRVFSRPDTIGSVNAAPGNGSATLTFAAPGNGGEPISRFEVQWNGGSASFPNGDGTTSLTVTGLSNGADYAFQVRPCNTYCAPWSGNSNSVRPFGPPGAPTVSASAGGVQRVNFSWTTPADNGSPITGFEYSIDNGPWTPTNATSASASGGYGSHSIRVHARNAAGNGADGSAAGNPTPPVVTIEKYGNAVGEPGCTDPSCQYIAVRVSGIRPGSYTFKPNTSAGNVGMVNATINVDGAGNGYVQTGNYFGFPNGSVSATIDGITGTRSPWR